MQSPIPTRRLALAVVLVSVVAHLSVGVAAETKKQGPERWEADIQKFEAADQASAPKSGGVLFIGSSSIRMWKTLAEDFPGASTINRGFGGSEMSDSIHFSERIVLPYKPRQIVVYAGDNDISRGKTAEVVAEDFKRFVKTVRAGLPDVRLGFIAIKPSLKRWNLAPAMEEANKKIRDYCRRERGVVYLDIWTPMLGKDGKPKPELFAADGLHLSREGYDLWTSVIRPYVK